MFVQIYFVILFMKSQRMGMFNNYLFISKIGYHQLLATFATTQIVNIRLDEN